LNATELSLQDSIRAWIFSAWRTPDVALKTVATVRVSVKAVQADGSSEFMAEFEVACQTKDMALYVPPPQSPQMDDAVERCSYCDAAQLL
jgi:hypothetical protein